jgi:D-alanine-D-alanine ligase
VIVAVLCGGRSFERSVSLRSGAAVAEAVRQLGHEAVEVELDGGTAAALRESSADVAFVALHGGGGEDGSLQDLLELVGVPYTGSRPGPTRVAHDKAQTKRHLIAAGIATPEFVSLSAAALREFGAADVLGEVASSIGFPLVVKPARGGSALGVRLVRSRAELAKAVVGATSYDDHVLVERFVDGREVAVAVVGTDESMRALAPVRIVPRNAEWFDAVSRHGMGEVDFRCPPTDLSEEELAALETAAIAACRELDLSGFARVDAIVDADGVPQILELDSVPGMTDVSLVPIAWTASGQPLSALVDELLRDALAQGPET